MSFVGENFGREVLACAANCPPSLAGADATGKAKIRQFGRVRVVEKYVFGFEIAMQNVESVDVLDSLANAFEYERNLLVFELPLTLNIVKKGPFGGVFEDQMDQVPLAQNFVELDHIFVVEGRVDVDFLFDVLELLLLEFGLVDLG